MDRNQAMAQHMEHQFRTELKEMLSQLREEVAELKAAVAALQPKQKTPKESA